MRSAKTEFMSTAGAMTALAGISSCRGGGGGPGGGLTKLVQITAQYMNHTVVVLQNLDGMRCLSDSDADIPADLFLWHSR